MALDWGDVPTWVGGVGTTAAVLWAVATWRGRASDARRVAVSGVAAWLEAEQEDYDDRAVFLVVQNQTEHPIFAVSITANRQVAQPLEWEMLPPRAIRRVRAVNEWVPVHEDYSANVAMAFTDTRGRRWRRDGATHDLREV